MKVRIQYTKTDSMRYIGHLDIMRYFQKAVKRAGLDIAYSQGFHPHQLMSFAAPLALGVTSEGEYFEAEFNTLITSEEFVRRFNEQMVDGISVNKVVLLPEGAKKSMSIVAASDYTVTVREDLSNEVKTAIIQAVDTLMDKPAIEVFRKTKKQEKTEDIKSGIYELKLIEDKIYMMLATGSVYNLKPDSVLEALCIEAGFPYDKFNFRIHRIETYTRNENNEFIPLSECGSVITNVDKKLN